MPVSGQVVISGVREQCLGRTSCLVIRYCIRSVSLLWLVWFQRLLKSYQKSFFRKKNHGDWLTPLSMDRRSRHPLSRLGLTEAVRRRRAWSPWQLEGCQSHALTAADLPICCICLGKEQVLSIKNNNPWQSNYNSFMESIEINSYYFLI